MKTRILHLFIPVLRVQLRVTRAVAYTCMLWGSTLHRPLIYGRSHTCRHKNTFTPVDNAECHFSDATTVEDNDGTWRKPRRTCKQDAQPSDFKYTSFMQSRSLSTVMSCSAQTQEGSCRRTCNDSTGHVGGTGCRQCERRAAGGGREGRMYRHHVATGGRHRAVRETHTLLHTPHKHHC